MKLIFAALIVLATASASLADECMALWKERNGYFHDVGYCFGQPLGSAYFGNEGCRADWGPLSPDLKRRIDDIRAREKTLGCDERKYGWTVAMLIADDRAHQLARAPAPKPEVVSPSLGMGQPIPNGEGMGQKDLSVGRLKNACDQGNASACTQVGMAYATGDGVKRNIEDALDYYDQGCDGNDPSGCSLLAGLIGMFPNQTDETSQAISALVEKACELGDEYSCESRIALMTDDEKKELLEDNCINKRDGKSCKIYMAKLITEDKIPLENREVQKFAKLACEMGEPDICKYVISDAVSSTPGSAEIKAALETGINAAMSRMDAMAGQCKNLSGNDPFATVGCLMSGFGSVSAQNSQIEIHSIQLGECVRSKDNVAYCRYKVNATMGGGGAMGLVSGIFNAGMAAGGWTYGSFLDRGSHWEFQRIYEHCTWGSGNINCTYKN